MATAPPPQNHHFFPFKNFLQKPTILILLLTILASISYMLGSLNFSSPTKSTIPTSQSPSCKLSVTNSTHKTPLPKSLDFQPRHYLPDKPSNHTLNPNFPFKICPKNFTDYCPCQDPYREKQFTVTKLFHRERHCPDGVEKLRCLVPRPVGYKRPFLWPKSRDQAWFSNVPFKRLTVLKKDQNWVRLEGDRLVFPGGGTSFPMGVKGYIDLLKKIVPLKTGAIRTVLDTGCGVASFGAALMDYNILTMSIAPRDIHEAQVQFALERGLPAMLGLLGTYRLPFPSRSFDMAHCSRCLIPWAANDGLYLLEIDRILRPGGYWVLSGPPINWRVNYRGWERTPEDLENEQKGLEDLAKRLCWKKVKERGPIAVWQKPYNHLHCLQKIKIWKSPKFCTDEDPDSTWYREMDACITPLPSVVDVHEIAGGALQKWPKRLRSVPPRIGSKTIEGYSTTTFNEDDRLWKMRVSYYGRMVKALFTGEYRNVMDMNAGLGGFAASLSEYPVWVMNVVPFDAKNNTLGIIYERGLIGTYMNWCEPFSTYPRSYDLIHAAGVFSLYLDKCDILDILVEMYRILRPGGTIIIRDDVDIVVKVKDYVDQMKWNTRFTHSQAGPYHPEKILFVDM